MAFWSHARTHTKQEYLLHSKHIRIQTKCKDCKLEWGIGLLGHSTICKNLLKLIQMNTKYLHNKIHTKKQIYEFN